MNKKETIKNNTTSYRWIIATMCFVLVFFVIGLGGMTKTLYIDPVTTHFNFSRGEFSLTFSIITGMRLIIQMFYGYTLKRFGIRLLVSLGMPIMAIGFFIFTKASTLRLFYLGSVIVGIVKW